MSKPDGLLVDIATAVEAEQSNQMALTVVVQGAVITGRLAPEAVWRRRVAEVLRDSDRLGAFSPVLNPPVDPPKEPEYLHFHVARILQGSYGIPTTGGMYRIAIENVGAWTLGDVGYTDS
ncbi:hypothetical protein [Streptomyces sp. ST2-7A]|uniref:hypothetical protein n=1 Tax=Streptomyces sp. ST2-7A TaxID=2907214 RepID=UPI001F1A44B3|nr:hypothetical protein [Streptomyces sp. ST2-7A]MCE7081827.1 hypothetical protein [Streptomyces sp. ST2-7A]